MTIRRAPVAVVFSVVLLAGCGAVGSPGVSVTPARPTPVPTLTEPPPSEAPASPTAPTAGYAWKRLATVASTISDLVGIAASPAGYVALERQRTVWFSPDGKRWTQATLPFQTSNHDGHLVDAWANEIVASPDGFEAVGGYDVPPCTTPQADGGPPPCGAQPISWSSSDGLTWRSSLSTPIPSDGSKLPAYSQFARAWPAAGGFDAAVEARDSVRYHGDTLLHSTDGRVWTRLAPGPLPQGKTGDDVYAHGGAATPTGRRLLWQVEEDGFGIPTATLASSPDGLAWTPISGFDGVGAFVTVALGPDAGAAGPWLLAGDLSGPTSTSSMSWFSDDLAAWRTGPIPTSEAPNARVSAAVHGAGGYIALGSYYTDAGQAIPVTWLSPDGTTWSLVAAPAPAPIDGPTFLATGPAGLIGIGSTGDSGFASWLGVGP